MNCVFFGSVIALMVSIIFDQSTAGYHIFFHSLSIVCFQHFRLFSLYLGLALLNYLSPLSLFRWTPYTQVYCFDTQTILTFYLWKYITFTFFLFFDDKNKHGAFFMVGSWQRREDYERSTVCCAVLVVRVFFSFTLLR